MRRNNIGQFVASRRLGKYFLEFVEFREGPEAKDAAWIATQFSSYPSKFGELALI
jgi:hypothetical protein